MKEPEATRRELDETRSRREITAELGHRSVEYERNEKSRESEVENLMKTDHEITSSEFWNKECRERRKSLTHTDRLPLSVTIRLR